MTKWKIMKKRMERGGDDTSSDSSDSEEIPQTRHSDEVAKPKYRWTNKQRVLIFASRGITYRDRHLMNSFRQMLAHSKEECKFEKKDSLVALNEIAEMKNCNKVIFFENRKRKDTYIWMANMGVGPTIKFLAQNIHTMEELKFTGNCLRGSRPFLSFDESFETAPWSRLVKELLVQIFGTPAYHPKSQPFFDHVFTFCILDKRIWFRNYQIIEEDGSLVEIGPRFCLNLIKIFEGPFSGRVIYTNPHYVAPNKMRKLMKQDNRHVDRKEQKMKKQIIDELPAAPRVDPYADVFETKPPEEARGAEKHTYYRLDTDASKEKNRKKNQKRKTVKAQKKADKKGMPDPEADALWEDMEAE